MNTLKYLLLILSLLQLVACASFDSNNKGIVYSGGSSYKVPYGAQYVLLTADNVSWLQGYGVFACHVNDIFWVSQNYAKKHNIHGVGSSGASTGMIDNSPESLRKPVLFGKRDGFLGCSSALTAHESYDLQKQKKESKATSILGAIGYLLNSSTRGYNSTAPSYVAPTYQAPAVAPMDIREPASKYRSTNGNYYKYDLSKPTDRVLYDANPAAQIMDNANPNVQLDRGLGQQGGGIYNQNNMECITSDDCLVGQNCRSKAGGGAECR